jgi:AraC family transcriptional regulator of arabinose operon
VYLTTATRYIKAHYTEDVTVDKVASYVGISRKYLFAIFKNTLNVSPKDYIINYRIEKACEFLKDFNVPIGNVAYSVGYKDPLTFSKMFKQKTGVSPTEYRKKH